MLSVRWMPSEPWLPPRVVGFRSGKWLIAFDRSFEQPCHHAAGPVPPLRSELAPDCSKATFDIVHQDKNPPLKITRSTVDFDQALFDSLSAKFDDE